MISKTNKQTKRKIVQRRKNQLRGESNLDHLHGRWASRLELPTSVCRNTLIHSFLVNFLHYSNNYNVKLGIKT